MNKTSYKKMFKFYNGPYGHTYFYNTEGDLIAAPTTSYGFDKENILYVSEFVEPLTKRQLKQVKEALELVDGGK